MNNLRQIGVSANAAATDNDNFYPIVEIDPSGNVVSDALGVPVIGEAGVRYADDRRATKKVVNAVEVSLLGRNGIFRAIVEPDRSNAIITRAWARLPADRALA